MHRSTTKSFNIIDKEGACAGLLCKYVTIELEGKCEVCIANASMRIEEHSSRSILRYSSIEMPNHLIRECL